MLLGHLGICARGEIGANGAEADILGVEIVLYRLLGGRVARAFVIESGEKCLLIGFAGHYLGERLLRHADAAVVILKSYPKIVDLLGYIGLLGGGQLQTLGDEFGVDGDVFFTFVYSRLLDLGSVRGVGKAVIRRPFGNFIEVVDKNFSVNLGSSDGQHGGGAA